MNKKRISISGADLAGIKNIAEAYSEYREEEKKYYRTIRDEIKVGNIVTFFKWNTLIQAEELRGIALWIN